VIVELALAAVNVLSFVLAVQHHFWAIALYAAIFATGLGGLVVVSVHQRLRPRIEQPLLAAEPVLVPD